MMKKKNNDIYIEILKNRKADPEKWNRLMKENDLLLSILKLREEFRAVDELREQILKELLEKEKEYEETKNN